MSVSQALRYSKHCHVEDISGDKKYSLVANQTFDRVINYMVIHYPPLVLSDSNDKQVSFCGPFWWLLKSLAIKEKTKYDILFIYFYVL